jgi:hypothetical protein
MASPAFTSVSAAAPAQSIAYSAAPAQSIAYSAAPAQSIAISAAPALSIAAAPVADNRWAEYSPEQVILPAPALPAPDYRCYAPPQVPPGQTRYLKVDEPTAVKNLAQNFADVRTAVRENNTHVQRNKTLVTNIARNHNHLLRIITNENNFEHNLTNNLVRVADIHRQKIENIKGETRNFKDFKATQKVEAAGCSRDANVAVSVAAPAQVAVAATPALTVVAASPARSIAASGRLSVLAPSTTTSVRYL